MKNSAYVYYQNGTWYLPKRCVERRKSSRWYYFDADSFEVFWSSAELSLDPDDPIYELALHPQADLLDDDVALKHLERCLSDAVCDRLRICDSKRYCRLQRCLSWCLTRSETSEFGRFYVKPAVRKE